MAMVLWPDVGHLLAPDHAALQAGISAAFDHPYARALQHCKLPQTVVSARQWIVGRDHGQQV